MTLLRKMDSGKLGKQHAKGDGGKLADSNVPKKKRKPPEKPWKKPKDMPKRPLSAYNLFFKDERERIKSARDAAEASPSSQADSESDTAASTSTKAKSGLGFAKLAQTIAKRWKELDPETRAPYEMQAAKDKERYDKEVAVWREEQRSKKDQAQKQATETLESASAAEEPPGESLNSFEPFDHKACHTPSSNGGYPDRWFEADGTTGELTPINAKNGDPFLLEPTSPLTLEWTQQSLDPRPEQNPYIIHNDSNLQQRLHENHMQQLQEQQLLLQMQSQQLQQQYQENQEMQQLLHNQRSQAFIFHNNNPATFNTAEPSRPQEPQYMSFITAQNFADPSSSIASDATGQMVQAGMFPSGDAINSNLHSELASSAEDFSLNPQNMPQDSTAYLTPPSQQGVGALAQGGTMDTIPVQRVGQLLSVLDTQALNQGAPIGQTQRSSVNQELGEAVVDLTQLSQNPNPRGIEEG